MHAYQRYGRDHWPGCWCDDCRHMYEVHQLEQVRKKAEYECDCTDCHISRRLLAGLSVQQTAVGDLIPFAKDHPPRLDYNRYPIVDPVGKLKQSSMYGKNTPFVEFEGPEGAQWVHPVKERKVATVNVCDGCGAIGKNEAMGYVQWRLSPMTEDEGKELCPGCMEDFFLHFLATLGESGVKGGGKAFKEPYKPESKKGDDVEEASIAQLAAALFEKVLKNPQLAIEAGITKEQVAKVTTIDHDEDETYW